MSDFYRETAPSDSSSAVILEVGWGGSRMALPGNQSIGDLYMMQYVQLSLHIYVSSERICGVGGVSPFFVESRI